MTRVFDRGVRGHAKGMVNGAITSWTLARRGPLAEMWRFGDGGETRYDERNHGYVMACSGNKTPATTIAFAGTAQVTLLGHTGERKYDGVATFENAQETSPEGQFKFSAYFHLLPTKHQL